CYSSVLVSLRSCFIFFFFLFFCHCFCDPLSLHSFPTRRSSDLSRCACAPGRDSRRRGGSDVVRARFADGPFRFHVRVRDPVHCRSEEHTSELQSRENLVCRLLLEKKNKKKETNKNKSLERNATT